MTGLLTRVAAVAGLLVVGCLLAIPTADLYYKSSNGVGCARCHEIRGNYDSWRSSAHRNLNCTDCHASTTWTNLHRVSSHLSGDMPEQIALRAADVAGMTGKCRSCHRQEFAQWSSGAHSATYSRIFTNPEHNRKRLLMDDCFRCHGMHFDGAIGDAVQPVNTAGPWRLASPELANRPAIPCLGCHAMHRQGPMLAKAEQRVPGREEIARPSLGLFDRRSRMNVRFDLLPLPAIFEGERVVRTSPDQRQALCYQCHAPQASAQAWSGDDRTPLGVHEGLSCLACHQQHSENTRASCSTCHPRLSNCGIDVEKMDTTFFNSKSPHNVHTVRCADCHPKGIPKKKDQRAS